MKFSLIHCYTDKNKGDAAIIIATTQLIKDVDSNADISMYSTYGVSDRRFKTEHDIIRKHGDRVFPAIFSEPQKPFGIESETLRALTFLKSLIKAFMVLLSSNKFFLKCFLTKQERQSIDAFLASDVIMSKGGSFLCTENSSLRQSLSLIRMLFPFVLAFRYKKKVIIFSQSLGPVVGVFNNWLFKRVLRKVDMIYLRESLCLSQYKAVEVVCRSSRYEVIPDSAFYLRSDSKDTPLWFDTSQFNVGYTLVDHDFKYVESAHEARARTDEYKTSILESMKFLIESQNAVIHIFPQVTVDLSFTGHNDMKISRAVKDFFQGTKYEKNVNFYNENWSPEELRNSYREMDIFVGARLHSVIFALSVNTPSINIGYHGTKSQGILSQIDGYGEYIVDINTITKGLLINKIKNLLKNREVIDGPLAKDVARINRELLAAMTKVCQK